MSVARHEERKRENEKERGVLHARVNCIVKHCPICDCY